MAYILEWMPGLAVLWLWLKSRRRDAQVQEMHDLVVQMSDLMLQLRSAKDILEFDELLALVRQCAGRNDEPQVG